MAMQNASLSSLSSLSPNTTAHLDLKPVFGTGREERWEHVQKILREKISPLFGSQEELIQTLPSKDFKCRLLVEDSKPVGLLIYKTKLSNCEKWKDCLEIQTLFTEDQEKAESLNPLSSFLLKEVTKSMKELKATSLCVVISKKAVQMMQFFKQNQFEVIKEEEMQSLLGKRGTMVPPSPEKPLETRKEASSEKQEEEKPSRKRSRDETSFEPSKKAKMDSNPILNSSNTDSASTSFYFPLQRSFSEGCIFSRKNGQSTGIKSPARPIDECPIQRKYFDMIKNGQKTIEGRINSHPFNKWYQGQEIRFKNGNDFVSCKIVKISSYNTFHTMLNCEGYVKCIPDARSLEDAVNIYQRIPNYPMKESQYGVLAIQIHPIGGEV